MRRRVGVGAVLEQRKKEQQQQLSRTQTGESGGDGVLSSSSSSTIADATLANKTIPSNVSSSSSSSSSLPQALSSSTSSPPPPLPPATPASPPGGGVVGGVGTGKAAVGAGLHVRGSRRTTLGKDVFKEHAAALQASRVVEVADLFEHLEEKIQRVVEANEADIKRNPLVRQKLKRLADACDMDLFAVTKAGKASGASAGGSSNSTNTTSTTSAGLAAATYENDRAYYEGRSQSKIVAEDDDGTTRAAASSVSKSMKNMLASFFSSSSGSVPRANNGKGGRSRSKVAADHDDETSSSSSCYSSSSSSYDSSSDDDDINNNNRVGRRHQKMSRKKKPTRTRRDSRSSGEWEIVAKEEEELGVMMTNNNNNKAIEIGNFHHYLTSRLVLFCCAEREFRGNGSLIRIPVDQVLAGLRRLMPKADITLSDIFICVYSVLPIFYTTTSTTSPPSSSSSSSSSRTAAAASSPQQRNHQQQFSSSSSPTSTTQQHSSSSSQIETGYAIIDSMGNVVHRITAPYSHNKVTKISSSSSTSSFSSPPPPSSPPSPPLTAAELYLRVVSNRSLSTDVLTLLHYIQSRQIFLQDECLQKTLTRRAAAAVAAVAVTERACAVTKTVSDVVDVARQWNNVGGVTVDTVLEDVELGRSTERSGASSFSKHPSSIKLRKVAMASVGVMGNWSRDRIHTALEDGLHAGDAWLDAVDGSYWFPNV